MNKKLFKRVILTLFITASFIVTVSATPTKFEQLVKPSGLQDLDPLVDLEVTVEIQAIRSLQKFEYPNPKTLEVIDWISDPDFLYKSLLTIKNLLVISGMIQNIFTIQTFLRHSMFLIMKNL